MLFQIRLDPLRQHRHAILPAFAVPDDDLIEREIDILYPQAQAFQQPHSRAKQQRRDQLMRSNHDAQNPLHFVLAKHKRPTLRLFRSRNIAELAQRFLQHPVVKKNQRVERLLLRASGNVLSNGQVRQIKLHLQSPHFPRMLFIVIKNESPNPAHVRLFRPRRIMIYAQHVPDVIEQLARLRGRPAKLLFSSWESIYFE
jgi:hypothetical protein